MTKQVSLFLLELDNEAPRTEWDLDDGNQDATETVFVEHLQAMLILLLGSFISQRRRLGSRDDGGQ